MEAERFIIHCDVARDACTGQLGPDWTSSLPSVACPPLAFSLATIAWTNQHDLICATAINKQMRRCFAGLLALYEREGDACVSCPWKQASTSFLPSPLLVHSPPSHSYLKFPNTKQVKGDVPVTSGHSIFEVYSNIRYTYTSIIANCSLLSQRLHIRHEPQWLHAIASHKCFLYKYIQVLLVQ